MIRVEHKGSFKDTERWLARLANGDQYKNLPKLVEKGVDALKQATPKLTGKTAESWSGGVEYRGSNVEVFFDNSNVNQGVNVAVLLQYGHGTGTGGYVEGQDYINPALKPVFDEMEESVMQEVRSK